MAAGWFSYGVPLALILSLGACKPQLRSYAVDSAASSVMVGGNGSEFRVESLMVSDGSPCDKMEEYTWYSDFHDCFVDRKYKDGGRDLDAIVDRILNHAETCVATSKRPCRLDYEGFKFLMNKVIEQMKDFSVMYMEAIYKGRENVKDLECVEDVLTVQTYVECFKSRVSSLDDKRSQSLVRDGLICANRQNRGCSSEALTTFNRIVRTLLRQKNPEFESFTPSTTTPSTTTPTTPRSSPDWRRFQEEEEEDPEPTPEPPMRWYDYIFQPFISAWSWVKSLFG